MHRGGAREGVEGRIIASSEGFYPILYTADIFSCSCAAFVVLKGFLKEFPCSFRGGGGG